MIHTVGMADSKRSLCMKGTDTPEGKRKEAHVQLTSLYALKTQEPSDPSDYKAGWVCLFTLFALEITRMHSLAILSICLKVDLSESPPEKTLIVCVCMRHTV